MPRPLLLIRTWLLTGLAVFAPVVVTLWVAWSVFGLLDNWAHKLPFYFPGLGVLILLGVILLIGVLVSNFLGRQLVRWVDEGIFRLPGVGVVYRTVKEFSKTLLNRDKNAFRQVVAVEFPRPGMYAIGFITGDAPAAVAHLFDGVEGAEGPTALVFIMQAFSPATGFLVAVPERRLTKLDMPVEEAFKLILTGGIVRKGDDHP